MPSNGILITRLIPLISALITAFKPFRIPSLIPLKIAPPLLNTFFTACHASANVPLNQSLTLPNAPLILFQAPAKNLVTASDEKIPLIAFHAPVNFSENHEPIELNALLISFLLSVNHFPMLENASLTPFTALSNLSLNQVPALSKALQISLYLSLNQSPILPKTS